MEWTEIFLGLGFFVNLFIAINTAVTGRRERDKLEAETAGVYARMVADGAEREKKLLDEIHELRNKVEEQSVKIKTLSETLDAKDKRVRELEILTQQQEGQIQKLQKELDDLRKSK